MSSEERSISGGSRHASRSGTHSPPPRRKHSRSRSRSHHRRRRTESRSPGYSRRNGDGGYRRGRRSRSPLSSRRRHQGSREDPKPSNCIGVFGLSVYTTERQLTQIFDRFGPLEKVQVVLDAKTGRSRGFAFVYFANTKDATTAKEECSGMEVDNKKIRVDYSITERAHTPTPGVYMGRPTTSDRPSYGGGGSSYRGGQYRERYRSTSPPRYRSSRRDRYERSERGRDYDRYERSSYDKGDRSGYDRKSYERSRSPRSRSPSMRRYRY